MKDERVPLLFGNAKEIERANKELSLRLDKCVGQFSNEEKSVLFYVASTFLEMAPKLVVYDRYCKNYDRAMELYGVMKDEPKFSAAMERQRNMWGQRVNGLLLSDFLIKPVQRICKYPLLFKALINYTDPNHSDLALLKQAEAAMGNAAIEVNRARQDQKSAADLKEIDDQMEGYGESLLQPGRSLIKQGSLIKLSPQGGKQERYFFLMTDMILYAKKGKKTYEYKDHIELSELSVIEADKSFAKGLSSADMELCFGLVRQDKRKKKHYAIIAETLIEKRSWMKELSEACETASRRKQTVSEDAIQQLESRLGRSKTNLPHAEGGGRTFSIFGKPGKSPRGNTLTQEDAAPDPAGLVGNDEIVLAAVKSVRQQVGDTSKLLAQAQALQTQLQQKVEVMQRMVDLEASARQELEERVAVLEGGGDAQEINDGNGDNSNADNGHFGDKKPAKPLPKVSKPLPLLDKPSRTLPKSPLPVPRKAMSSPKVGPRPPQSSSGGVVEAVPRARPLPKTRVLPSAQARKPLPGVSLDSDNDMASTPPLSGNVLH